MDGGCNNNNEEEVKEVNLPTLNVVALRSLG